jgi:hypothetical protein
MDENEHLVVRVYPFKMASGFGTHIVLAIAALVSSFENAHAQINNAEVVSSRQHKSRSLHCIHSSWLSRSLTRSRTTPVMRWLGKALS